jgi:hypothetical protein
LTNELGPGFRRDDAFVLISTLCREVIPGVSVPTAAISTSSFRRKPESRSLRRKPESRSLTNELGSGFRRDDAFVLISTLVPKSDSGRFSADCGYFYLVIPAQAGIQLFSPAA